jgi:hypothetical protein
MSDMVETRRRADALRRRGYEVSRIGTNRWRITRPGCVGAVHIGGSPERLAGQQQVGSEIAPRVRRATG